MAKREIQWLLQQLPEWEEEGIVSAEQTRRIKARYTPDGEAPAGGFQPGVVAIGIVGALLIGGGIISIIAYNWEYLSQRWQTAISFIPLLLGLFLYGYVWFRRSESLVWRESASAVLMLFLATTISLISNTWQMGDPADAFLKPWLILSIPLLYLMNSSLSAIIYAVGITIWTLQVSRPETVGYWFFLLALIPHLVYNFRRMEENVRRQLLAWALLISWTFGWFAAVPGDSSEYDMLGTGLWLSVFALLSAVLFPGARQLLRQPPLLYALAGIFMLVIMCAYGIEAPPFNLGALLGADKYPAWAAGVNLAVLLALFAAWLFLGWRIVRQEDYTPERVLLWALPVVLLLYIFLSNGEEKVPGAIALGNLYGLALGIAYLRQGVRSSRLLELNIGMLFILALAITRFFDADWSLVVKGVAFILLGMGFLGANVYMVGYRRKGV